MGWLLLRRPCGLGPGHMLSKTHTRQENARNATLLSKCALEVPRPQDAPQAGEAWIEGLGMVLMRTESLGRARGDWGTSKGVKSSICGAIARSNSSYAHVRGRHILQPKLCELVDWVGSGSMDPGWLRAAVLSAVLLLSCAGWARGETLDEVRALNNEVMQLYQAGKYPEAAELAKQSLALAEQKLGAEHPELAQPLYNLGLVYAAQARYGEAEQLYRRSLVIRENALGPEHADVAQSLIALGGLYRIQGRLADAEPLSRHDDDRGERLRHGVPPEANGYG